MRAVHAVGLDLLGEERHEGGVEGALGEQPAERVGKLEGGVEGVGDRPGAERGRHQHLAREAEHAAHQRAGGDSREFLDEAQWRLFRRDALSRGGASAGVHAAHYAVAGTRDQASDFDQPCAMLPAVGFSIFWPVRSVT